MAFSSQHNSIFNNPEPLSSFELSNRELGRSIIPDPYVLYSTTHMPTNLEDVLRLSEYTWLTSSQYTQALRRAGRYFITTIEFKGVESKEEDKYKEFFNDHLQIKGQLELVIDDFLCYGNSFTSLYLPFHRIVTCKKCGLVRNIDKIADTDVGVEPRTKQLIIRCVVCKAKEIHGRKDIRSSDETKVNIIRWNPHEMRLLHNFITGETTYIWEVSQDLKVNIKENKGFWIKKTPWEIVEAALEDRSFKFADGVIFHMKEPTIAGVRNRGWGIPKIMAAYKDAYYVQVLKRFNEALAMDYIVPFRLLTPASSAGGVDPLLNYDMSEWRTSLTNMIEEHRRDPAGWQTAPFPVNYQVLGGEGQTMSPWQLLKHGTADLLDALGIPMELFQGTLNFKAAPTALRLFESTWDCLPTQMNAWLNWITGKISNVFGWKNATAHLQPVAYADDLERKNILLQLAASQQISGRTGYSPWGLDIAEEQKQIMEENRGRLELEQEFQEDEIKKQEMRDMSAAQSGQGAQPPQVGMGAGLPGMPQAGAGGAPTTPDAVLAQAQELAGQIQQMPPAQRRSYLINLKHSNTMLHAQVKQELENLENQAAQQGVVQARGQGY